MLRATHLAPITHLRSQCEEERSDCSTLCITFDDLNSTHYCTNAYQHTIKRNAYLFKERVIKESRFKRSHARKQIAQRASHIAIRASLVSLHTDDHIASHPIV
jgi:hypothetical protein